MDYADTRRRMMEAIDICFDKVVKEKVSVSISLEPDGRLSMDVSPWEPFHYTCPYTHMCVTEKGEHSNG